MTKRIVAIALAAVLIMSSAPTAAIGAPKISGQPFNDVASDDYCAPAVAQLKTLGLMSGYPDGSFRPNSAITRAEFCAVAVRALGLHDLAESMRTLPPPFSDGESIPVWARGYVNVAYGNGIMQGRPGGRFDPHANVLVEEAVAVLVRALDYDDWVSDNWPFNYLVKAHDLGLNEDVAYFQARVPIIRSDVAVLVSNALWVYSPDQDTGKPDAESGQRWADATAVEGKVTDLSPFTVGDDDYDLAGTVYLFGAGSLNDLVNTKVTGLRNEDGDIGYLSAGEHLVTSEGDFYELEIDWRYWSSHDVGVLIGDDDHEWTFTPDTDWLLNGEPFDPSMADRDRDGDFDYISTEVSVAAVMNDDDEATAVTLFTWDIEEAIVREIEYDKSDDEYIIEIDDDVDGRRSTTGEAVVEELTVTGDVNDLDDVQENDVVRIATKGADGISRGDFDPYRMEVKRATVSGKIDEVITYSSTSGNYWKIRFTSGSSVKAYPDTWDDPENPDDLAKGGTITFGLNFAGDAKLITSDLVAQGDWVLVKGYSSSSDIVIVDRAGQEEEYEDPTGEVDSDWLGEIASFELDYRDRITDARMAEEMDYDYVATVYSKMDDGVVLKVRWQSGPNDGETSYWVAENPAVYDEDDDHVGLPGLSVGDEVMMLVYDLNDNHYTDSNEVVALRLLD